MKTRTYEEMKAYVDGYNACYKQYNEILSNGKEPFYKRIEKMKIFVSAVNGVLEREQISRKENCTSCILDGTDACSRGSGRAVDDEICEDYISRKENE